MSFEGKTAIVTGAAGGMGLAFTRTLLNEGANVAGLDAQKIDAIEDQDSFMRFKGSVADWLFVSRAVKEAHGEFGRIDYLVNAAGVIARASTTR